MEERTKCGTQDMMEQTGEYFLQPLEMEALHGTRWTTTILPIQTQPQPMEGFQEGAIPREMMPIYSLLL
ncbi:MAG: hypothetical protein BWY29_01036 [Microgenomates group bacterium ADurb.Bin238]|nr:MAG: hypothetical protein BWY29_01036 [Microgenomates group bacterium ADurb.Bin238]